MNKKIILTNLHLSNIGCEIILRGTIAFLNKTFPQYDLKFYFPSYQLEYDRELLSDLVNVEVIPMVEWKRYYRGILRKAGLFNKLWVPRFDSKYFLDADLFVSVGGDIYTMFGDDLPEDWLGYEGYASKNNIPSIMFGANMERFEILSLKNQTKLLDHLQRFKALLVRDYGTKNYVASFGVKNNVDMFPDPIFSLRDRTKFERKKIKTIGINFTPILLRDFGEEIADLYAKLISGLLKKNYKVKLIPHVTSVSDNAKLDDRKAMNSLVKKLSEEDSDKIEILDKDFHCNLENISKELQKIDLLIGARMHACLNTLTLGKSVMFLAYSSKAHTMVETLKNDTPFEEVKHCFTSIQADEVNLDKVEEFIARQNLWVTNGSEPVIVDTENYMSKLPARSLVETLI